MAVPNPLAPKIDGIIYGGDYNPEQWSEQVWIEDVRLMKEAGVNMVSLGIFAWAAIEAKQGTYEFGWLDRVMDLLQEQGVMVNLATATASPPPWFSKKYPDSLPVTVDCVQLWPGSRQHFCPSNPDYRRCAQKLVTKIAQRYNEHPALAIWHIGNEYGCHLPECYCDVSAEAFRAWLKSKYGSVTALNKAWETAFWSQQISDWSEIFPPRKAPYTVNPTQQLDFKQFSSDELLQCFLLESKILKQFCPDIPVTTNFMGFFKSADYWKWSRYEDVVSNDSYPDPSDPDSICEAAMSYDLMRSLAKENSWLLMEQTAGQVNWRSHNVLKRPGQMRALSYQAIARGADGVMFFQWRASKGGSEKFHSAMVSHAGTENSRIWSEVKALGEELEALKPVLAGRTLADVAIMFDWRNWWALELDSKPSLDVKMIDQLKSFYQPLYQSNVTVDFVNPKSDLAGYKLVVVPNLYLVEDDVAPRLEKFVSEGGLVVMSFFTGIVDENDHIRLGGYPAPFRRLLGLRVDEFDPYKPGQSNQIKAGKDYYDCDLWSDLITLEGAEALATYCNDFYAGQPAIARHAFGKGAGFYVGTRPEPKFMQRLLGLICQEAKVEPLNFPGLEIVERQTELQRFAFLINHSSEKVDIKLGNWGSDLLNGKRTVSTFTVPPLGVAVIASDVAVDCFGRSGRRTSQRS